MTETPQHDRVHTENLRDYAALRRSTTDRKIAGVAGGLGRHLNIDPTIIRVLLVVLCFFGGAGFLIYGVAWLLVPEEGQEEGHVHVSPGTRSGLLIAAGVVGALLLVGGGVGRFGVPWPLAIVALVVFLVLVNRERPQRGASGPSAGPDAGPVPPAAAAGPEPVAGEDAGYGTATYGTAPPAPPWTPPTQQAAHQPPRPARPHGPLMLVPTLALVAIALGVLGLYDVSGGSVVGSAYPALALAVVGAMLLLGSFLGRAGGLVLLGLVAAFALAVTSAADGWPGRFVTGDRHIAATPYSAAAVHHRYSLPSGQVKLDLTRVQDPAALDGRTIDLHANAGELLVLLPSNLSADVSADVNGPGDVNIDGATTGGIGTHVDRVLTGSDDVGLVTLNLDLSVGHIEVRQQ